MLKLGDKVIAGSTWAPNGTRTPRYGTIVQVNHQWANPYLVTFGAINSNLGPFSWENWACYKDFELCPVP